MDKTIAGIIILSVLVLGGIIASSSFSSDATTIARDRCVDHTGISMHIHPVVSITIDGAPYPIPANIGISNTCMKAVHTHDDSGAIHLEYPEQHDFTLGDFFAVWGQPLSATQVLDKTSNAYTFTVTADGEAVNDPASLVFKDKQNVAITLTKK